MLSEVQQPLIVFRRLAASTSTAAGQNLIGIFNESTGSNATTFNTIANMQNGTKGLRVDVHWIYATAGSSTLVKNNIHNLSSASLVTSVASVSGVEMGGTAAQYGYRNFNIQSIQHKFQFHGVHCRNQVFR
jgi:hypothetical protein